MNFSLDPRLETDALFVGKLRLTQVRLHNDMRFPWLVLIPQRPDVAEIFELNEAERALLTEEISACAAALSTVTKCHKINVGALGNIVRQMHVHIVARFEGDPAWPGPVWGFGTRQPYATEASAGSIARIRSALAMRG